jgi:hypothetical protein
MKVLVPVIDRMGYSLLKGLIAQREVDEVTIADAVMGLLGRFRM